MYSDFPGNFFPNSVSEVGFANPAAGDFRLNATSPYKGAATDGGDIGAQLGVAVAAQMSAGLVADGGFVATASGSSGGGCSLGPRGGPHEQTSLALTLAVLGFLAGRERRRRSSVRRREAENVELRDDSRSTDSVRRRAGVLRDRLACRG
jgi:hypothetical protein